jgi:hypothetical protein
MWLIGLLSHAMWLIQEGKNLTQDDVTMLEEVVLCFVSNLVSFSQFFWR